MGQKLSRTVDHMRIAFGKAVNLAWRCLTGRAPQGKVQENVSWNDCSDQELNMRKKEVDRKRFGIKKISISEYGTPITQPEQDPQNNTFVTFYEYN